MKVPPKRKGNGCRKRLARSAFSRLNESPSEKEGKFRRELGLTAQNDASMKVPPKRKGNS